MKLGVPFAVASVVLGTLFVVTLLIVGPTAAGIQALASAALLVIAAVLMDREGA